uniref:Uncharacterized protein n=1 Tax=Anguilla anguilla TaxID=7936 RepID=A0A0E9UNC2_ANGAN
MYTKLSPNSCRLATQRPGGKGIKISANGGKHQTKVPENLTCKK